MCWKHARDKGLEEPKRKKKVCAEQATKKRLREPRKPMKNDEKNDKDIHKKAKSQVE